MNRSAVILSIAVALAVGPLHADTPAPQSPPAAPTAAVVPGGEASAGGSSSTATNLASSADKPFEGAMAKMK